MKRWGEFASLRSEPSSCRMTGIGGAFASLSDVRSWPTAADRKHRPKVGYRSLSLASTTSVSSKRSGTNFRSIFVDVIWLAEPAQLKLKIG